MCQPFFSKEWEKALLARSLLFIRSRAYHFFDNMVDVHCARDEGVSPYDTMVGVLHWVRVRVRVTVYIIERICQPCCRKSSKVPSSLERMIDMVDTFSCNRP